MPPELTRRILIVDNNSTDATPAVAARLAAAAPETVVSLTEREQGRSAALNAGIRASNAELVGFIDDDETVAPTWLSAVAAVMQDPDIGFLGGPVLGDWQIEPPDWLPSTYPAVIGVVNPGEAPRDFGPDFPGILTGGNSVIRRDVLERVGLYSTALGRTAVGLRSGEDHDMYARLLRAGIRGRYVPELEVRHWIPAERLTKRYYRAWCYGHAQSRGQWLRGNREPVPYLAGIPRYSVGIALRSLAALLLRAPLGKMTARERLERELELWNLAGLVKGRYFG